MAVYEYVGRSFNVPAQKAGEVFEKIEKRDGALTPMAVVDEARPEDSVLHKVFEWNDAKAAEKYRLVQAGNIIRCIVRLPEKQEEKVTRAFVNIKPIDDRQKEPGTYMNVRSAFENPESREVVLSNARYEMRLFKRKYSQLLELSKVFAAIDEVLEEVGT